MHLLFRWSALLKSSLCQSTRCFDGRRYISFCLALDFLNECQEFTICFFSIHKSLRRNVSGEKFARILLRSEWYLKDDIPHYRTVFINGRSKEPLVLNNSVLLFTFLWCKKAWLFFVLPRTLDIVKETYLLVQENVGSEWCRVCRSLQNYLWDIETMSCVSSLLAWRWKDCRGRWILCWKQVQSLGYHRTWFFKSWQL